MKMYKNVLLAVFVVFMITCFVGFLTANTEDQLLASIYCFIMCGGAFLCTLNMFKDETED